MEHYERAFTLMSSKGIETWGNVVEKLETAIKEYEEACKRRSRFVLSQLFESNYTTSSTDKDKE